jgi:hypothetical protein
LLFAAGRRFRVDVFRLDGEVRRLDVLLRNAGASMVAMTFAIASLLAVSAARAVLASLTVPAEMTAMSGAAVTSAWPVSVRVRFGASAARAGAEAGKGWRAKCWRRAGGGAWAGSSDGGSRATQYLQLWSKSGASVRLLSS